MEDCPVAILIRVRQDTERKLLAPLRTHGWTVTIDREAEQGEYQIVKTERAGVEHRVAISEQFLECITAQRVFAKQLGAW